MKKIITDKNPNSNAQNVILIKRLKKKVIKNNNSSKTQSMANNEENNNMNKNLLNEVEKIKNNEVNYYDNNYADKEKLY